MIYKKFLYKLKVVYTGVKKKILFIEKLIFQDR